MVAKAKSEDFNPLDDLIEEESRGEGDNLSSEWYLISEIDVWPWLKNLRPWFDEDEEKSFRESIREDGFNSIIQLRRKPNGRLEAIAGLRRYLNGKKSGLERIRGHLHEDCDNTKAKKIALRENTQRKPLPNLLETEAILEILQEELEMELDDVLAIFREIASLRKKNDRTKKKGEKEVSYRSIGHYKNIERILYTFNKRKPLSFIANQLSLLNRPEPINNAIRDGKIDETRVSPIAKAWKKLGEFEAEELLEEAIAEDWDLERIKTEIEERTPEKAIDPFKQRIDNIKKGYSRLSPKDKGKADGWLKKVEDLCIPKKTEEVKNEETYD